MEFVWYIFHDSFGRFFFSNQYFSRGIQFSRASLNGALTQHKNKDIKTRQLIKLQGQHVTQALLFKMAL